MGLGFLAGYPLVEHFGPLRIRGVKQEVVKFDDALHCANFSTGGVVLAFAIEHCRPDPPAALEARFLGSRLVHFREVKRMSPYDPIEINKSTLMEALVGPEEMQRRKHAAELKHEIELASIRSGSKPKRRMQWLRSERDLADLMLELWHHKAI